MSWYRKILLLASGSMLVSISLAGQEVEKNIAGRLLDNISRQPIEDVVVVNKNSNKTTLTDAQGYYYLRAAAADTIIFYLVGYHVKKLAASEAFNSNKQVAVTFLIPNVEELREIEITAARRRDAGSPYAFNQTPADLSSPLTFIFERYSKKYQQYRKIEELEKAKYEAYLRETRFNKDIVFGLTGLKGEEASEFIDYCNFTTDYLLHASDYDFIVAVKKKYKYFSERR